MQFFQQLVSQRRCETSCWRIAQCNRGCLAIFFVACSVARSRTQVYFSQRIAATCNAIAQCITPPATFLAIFEPRFQRAHAQFLILPSGIWLPACLGQKYCKLLGEIAQCNRAIIFSATCFATPLRDKLLRKLHSVTAPLFLSGNELVLVNGSTAPPKTESWWRVMVRVN